MSTILTDKGLLMARTTVSFVNIYDVLDHIGFTADEVEAILDYGFNGATTTAADYTLIGNNYALECIINGIEGYYDELEQMEDMPSRTIPTHILGREEIVQKYWEVVSLQDYINMEGNG